MIKSYPVRIEAYDEINDLVFIVEAFDEACCTVTIKSSVTSKSWIDMSNKIKEAIERIEQGY